MIPVTCYVCKNEITKNPVNIGTWKDGQELYRHHYCAAGSYRWMEYQASLPKHKRSEVYKYFMEAEHNEDKV